MKSEQINGGLSRSHLPDVQGVSWRDYSVDEPERLVRDIDAHCLNCGWRLDWELIRGGRKPKSLLLRIVHPNVLGVAGSSSIGVPSSCLYLSYNSGGSTSSVFPIEK
jgi:hypothetical protein